MPISTRSKVAVAVARAPSPAKVARAAPKKQVAAAADENAAAVANTAAVAVPSRRQSLLKVPAKVVIDDDAGSEAEGEAPAAAKPVTKRALGSKKPAAEVVEAPAPSLPVAAKSRRASLGSSLVVVAESKSIKPTPAKLNAVAEEAAAVAVAPKRTTAATASRKPAASPAAMRVFLATPSIMLQEQVCALKWLFLLICLFAFQRILISSWWKFSAESFLENAERALGRRCCKGSPQSRGRY